ncbi:MAG: FAD-dependent oxidoreductase [Alphaproteobacteria bacterium]|nr:FAD-dependent oxidoreductase [Alphaproteobacteria bacterium]
MATVTPHAAPVYPYRRSADQDGGVARRKVVVVGAGPVGLTAALGLSRHGIPAVVIDDDDTVSVGSRAICYAKRTLEIWDRLGTASPLMAKGVTWNIGKVFFGRDPVFAFDLLPERGHQFPAFINLQQYYLEEALVDAAARSAGVELRWRNRLTGIAPARDGARLTIDTPEGPYELDADWVIACDGARSATRRLLGLDFKGKVFEDRFLIADVKMRAAFPSERWFWFEPPFHDGGSALLHKQADDVWRIDLQLGWDADPELEKKPERVVPRLRAMLGPDARFDLEWVSVYTFQCRRLDRFRHGRVIFAGDAAHQVSPFGARGANSGVQDVDNLTWKLAMVSAGTAPDTLLDSYDSERVEAADENILNSTRATDFITPKGAASRLFRDATLALARSAPFARRLVNSGRLSVPAVHRGSPLSTPDRDAFGPSPAPGTVAADAPVVRDGAAGWLLSALGGQFVALIFADGPVTGAAAAALRSLAHAPAPVRVVFVAPRSVVAPDGAALCIDADGLAAQRYDARPGTVYLVRPDQIVAARWRSFDIAAVVAALARAAGR